MFRLSVTTLGVELFFHPDLRLGVEGLRVFGGISPALARVVEAWGPCLTAGIPLSEKR